MYKPLPESLTISPSGIDGLGLFAKEGIGQGTNLGLSHLKIDETLFRTPLGGFINHSDNHNCVKVELRMTNEKFDYKKWNLVRYKMLKKEKNLRHNILFTRYEKIKLSR